METSTTLTYIENEISHQRILCNFIGRASNRNNSNLMGKLGLLCYMLVANHTFFFLIEYVFFTILTYDCS